MKKISDIQVLYLVGIATVLVVSGFLLVRPAVKSALSNTRTLYNVLIRYNVRELNSQKQAHSQLLAELKQVSSQLSSNDAGARDSHIQEVFKKHSIAIDKITPLSTEENDVYQKDVIGIECHGYFNDISGAINELETGPTAALVTSLHFVSKSLKNYVLESRLQVAFYKGKQ